MAVTMDQIVALSKRRGFLYPSSEIYGGFQAAYDYGPLGVELKRQVKEAWWNAMVLSREDVVGLDASILMSPRVWEASGHVEGFNDPLVDCRTCKGRFRADLLDELRCLHKPSKTPRTCGGELTPPRQFNMMFQTRAGPVEDTASLCYLRPETAQGIFVNFKNVLETARVRIPFGIAQIGKAFRNEIVTGNLIFRTREFEQMEMEYFCAPDADQEWYAYWKDQRLTWWHGLGIQRDRIRLREQGADELAHYARACADVEYDYPWGWAEVEGIAARGDFDLRRHAEASGRGLAYRDEEQKTWVLPWVIEPSAGVDRCVLTLLVDAYEEQVKPNGEKRTVLHLHPRLSPIQIGVFPLVQRDGMPEKARALFERLRGRLRCQYDASGTVGRRYSRLDEVGTPYCLTVDSQSLVDETVTLRDRDSMVQERVPAENALARIEDLMEAYDRSRIAPPVGAS